MDRAISPVGNGVTMKSELLRAAVDNVSRLLADPELRSVHGETLRKGLRELQTLQHGGKLTIRRVERFVALVAEILCDGLKKRKEPPTKA
jgi:hypothetical protein